MLKTYLEGINARGLVLASGSVGRKILCELIGLKFEVLVSGFPEDRDWREFGSPEDYALFNAQEKLKAVSSDKVLITADTVVCLDGEVFEKPRDRDDLIRMMRTFSGKTHTLVTAVIVKGILTQNFIDKTYVTMDELTDQAIENLADSPEEWQGHAGGYSIDGRLGPTIFKSISGNFHNVIGISLFELSKLLINEHLEYLKTKP